MDRDYEKAYKAVLKTAQQWIEDGCTDKERICLESAFPELRESEDERMMREFNDWLCEEIECRTNDLRDEKDRRTLNMLCYVLTKVKNWLEKQKEPHFTKRNALFDKCVENCDPEIMKRVSDEVDEMLEKEQKPAEWSEDDEEVMEDLYNFVISDFIQDHIHETRWKPWKTTLERNRQNRLKSIRPVSKESLQSWKPSEEQMKALSEAVYTFDGYEESDAIKSLYNDLKKLM